MLTDRGRLLLVTAGLAWGLSRAFGVPELQMAAVAVLVLVVLAVGYTALASARLTARRGVHPPRLFHDAEGVVELRLRNTGRVPTAILQVEDAAPTAIADGPRFVLRPLGPDGTTTVRYRLHGRHRGRYVIGPLTVRLRDPFGIAARGHRFDVTDDVVVYPPVWRLPPGVPLGGSQGSGGEGRPRPLASGDEIANIREYVRGDDLRKVHWRSTAHRGKLMVRQDESRATPHATVVLDARASSHRGTGPSASFEVAVSAAASATYHVSERGYSTRLLTAPMTTAPRSVPWELTLEQLAVAQPDDRNDLDGLWGQLAQGAGGDGLLIAVTVVPGPAELRRMVRAGRAFNTRLAVLVAAETFAGRRSVGDDSRTIADALRVAGWRVTVVAAGDRLDERWRQLLLQDRGAVVTAGGSR
ncbi:MAG: DUF58 domain-containing protein [Actinobacteria bacterium]|nr:DUF58 domain-containing protein [Actinomycetota bacterium]